MRSLALLPLLALSACATSFRSPPVEVLRYSLPTGIERGTAVAQPAQAGLMRQPYEAAVARELVRVGYPDPGAAPSQYLAIVDVRQRGVQGAARRSPIQIGIGGGGFSGGGWNGGGVGLGGGVGFPIGGGRGPQLVETELAVMIKRRADQTTVWEGHARAISDPRAPTGNDQAVAQRLAAALFTDFPGLSGTTISVP